MDGMKRKTRPTRNVIREVTDYIVRTGEVELPDVVVEKAKHHILDTLAAIISGSKLKAGILAKDYVKRQGGKREAIVVASRVVTSATHAAFANGIMAHSDETDDSHAKSLTHPGCAIIPAALALSERKGADGMTFLKGVVSGYDIGCRMTQALGVEEMRQRYRSTHSMGANFGAAAASASVLRLKGEKIKYVFSYTAQQTSGVTYWVRGDERVEKAFVFSGMPARNGVTAALLVESGFTGLLDPFSGERNFFEAFSSRPRPELLAEGLGQRYEITATNIKRYPVGSPIQAPLQALLNLIKKHDLKAEKVKRIVVRMAKEGLKTVDHANIPDIHLQYILAVTLLDGDLSFDAAHSYERMKERSVLNVEERISLIEDPQLSASENKRQGIVEITLKDGTPLREHVVSVRGTAENPMTRGEVEEKCRRLMKPVLGVRRTDNLIERIWSLERLKNIRGLRPLLSLTQKQ